MTIGGEERSNKILVGILSVLIFAIIGLTVGIVMVNRNQEERENRKIAIINDYDAKVESCMHDFNSTEVDCASLQGELEELVKVSDDEDVRVMAGINLSTMYSERDIDSATSILEEMLDSNLSDVNKYAVLDRILYYYKKKNDKHKYAEKLREIIALPDSMPIEREDWKTVKTMLMIELETIESVEVDNEAL